MGMSSEIGSLAGALAKAQSVYPEIAKDRHVTVTTKSGAQYDYDYADLATCFSAIRPVLNANGLSVVQLVETFEKNAVIRSMLLHESGQWIDGILTMPFYDFDAKSVASAITYGRRYGFLALVGAAPADEDDDGSVAAAEKATPKVREFRQAKAEPKPAAAEPMTPLVQAGKPLIQQLKESLEASGLPVSKITAETRDGQAGQVVFPAKASSALDAVSSRREPTATRVAPSGEDSGHSQIKKITQDERGWTHVELANGKGGKTKLQKLVDKLATAQQAHVAVRLGLTPTGFVDTVDTEELPF